MRQTPAHCPPQAAISPSLRSALPRQAAAGTAASARAAVALMPRAVQLMADEDAEAVALLMAAGHYAEAATLLGEGGARTGLGGGVGGSSDGVGGGGCAATARAQEGVASTRTARSRLPGEAAACPDAAGNSPLPHPIMLLLVPARPLHGRHFRPDRQQTPSVAARRGTSTAVLAPPVGTRRRRRRQRIPRCGGCPARPCCSGS